jgi:hypothetical protein
VSTRTIHRGMRLVQDGRADRRFALSGISGTGCTGQNCSRLVHGAIDASGTCQRQAVSVGMCWISDPFITGWSVTKRVQFVDGAMAMSPEPAPRCLGRSSLDRRVTAMRSGIHSANQFEEHGLSCAQVARRTWDLVCVRPPRCDACSTLCIDSAAHPTTGSAVRCRRYP